MKRLILAAIAAMPLGAAAITPLWLRNAQISPDGEQIAFTYMGDVWTVPSKGGQAVRLTSLPSYETYPIWSPDGKKIAFASDRHGNFDIFVVDAQGGTPKRLTYNSASEIPESFTPDGKSIIYSAAIQDPAQSVMFPSGRFTELYSVPVGGGEMQQVLGTPASMISYVPGSNGKMLYQDKRSMENEWRKHHTSSAARDIWVYDPADGSHANLTNHAGEDRNPVALADGTVYFLSERNGGSMNVYKASLSDASNPKAVTSFKSHPVRFLSASADGKMLCYTYDGELYTQAPDGKPKKVAIDLTVDVPEEDYKTSVGSPSEVAVSPDGKLVAIVYRGEVFVTTADYKTTKQITRTPAAEKHVTWGHDSKTLYYTSERDGRYNIYEAKMAHDGDQNFANATVIEEKPVFKPDNHERTVPVMSPDGKQLAFILDRTKLAVKDMKSGKVKEVTDGKTTTSRNGAFGYSWSPDSKWILLEIVDRKHDPYCDVAIVNVEDGSMYNLTETGYFDQSPRWAMDGNAIVFASDRYGMRNHASWGSMNDVMMVFLNRAAYDKFHLNKEDAELAEAAEKEKKKKEAEAEKDAKDKDKDKKKDDKDAEVKAIVFEPENVRDRVVRLTPFSSDLEDAIVTADGDKLFFITSGADNNTLWEYDLREGEISSSKSIARGLRGFDATNDLKTILVVGSSIQKLAPSSGKLTPITYSATFKIDPVAERQYMYDYIVREEGARFYEPGMHGVDWKALTDHYRKFLPHINNNYDFSEMESEILGELNVSHTGSGFRGNSSARTAERTGSLGLLYDLTYTGKGLRIDEIVAGGPFDRASTMARKGVIIEKINGEEITPANDYTILLTDLAGQKTLISLFDPATGERADEVVRPISQGAMSDLLYNRWVKNRAADVDRWSNGRLGYVHIESMDDASFRRVYADLLGKYNDREGVVIDIRGNGGGRLHEDIEVLFSAEKYLTQVVRGQEVGSMPSRRWYKPSIMVVAEPCYSNAHGTPWVYSLKGLGKTVGMPIAGTMTSVNWVTLQDPSMYFGIPVVGHRTNEGYYLENHQFEPDIKVDNNPADVVKGEDTQLRTAVNELLKELGN